MVNNKMKIGSLFSGIGGLELGFEWSGIGETIWQVENNSYCIQILEKQWPNAERYKDVKTVGKHNLKPVELICGGFPCQDISTAGKGAGLSGNRSGLWFEFYRIVHELEPEWVVVENVASAAKRWVDAVRGGLELIGYETIPIPLSAEDVGAPHLRKRVFIVGQAVETWSKRRWRSGGAYTIAECEQLRQQSGWGLGTDGKKASVIADNGSPWHVANPDSERKLQQKRSIEKQRGWPCHKSKNVPDTHSKSALRASVSRCEYNYWTVEPDVGRVADGVPYRMDRLRALGNAVVPQCAQVIGELIKQLTTDSVYGVFWDTDIDGWNPENYEMKTIDESKE